MNEQWKYNSEKIDLFPSFSFMLNMACAGYVDQQSLDTGLFCFQARRVLVFSDDLVETEVSLSGMYAGETLEDRWNVLRTVIRPALLKAESEERVLWREEYLGLVDIVNFLLQKDLWHVINKKMIDFHYLSILRPSERGLFFEKTGDDSFNATILDDILNDRYIRVWAV